MPSIKNRNQLTYYQRLSGPYKISTNYPNNFFLLYTYYYKRRFTSSVVFKELLILEYIHFTYYILYTRDLRETRIYTNTILKQNN